MSFSTDVARFLVISLLAMAPISALAEIGGAGPGGGDRCEDRFKVVAQDLESWIKTGGPASLKLDSSINVFHYEVKMLEIISRARVTCVGPGDKDYPVMVNGNAKECKNFVDTDGISRIVCDRAKFYSGVKNPDNDPSQYRIVHHEYASLAGFESPNADDSNYAISDQISEYLQDTIVKKLAIKKPVRDALCDQEIAWKKNVFEYVKSQTEIGHDILASSDVAQVVYLTTEYNCHAISVEDFCQQALPLAQRAVDSLTGLLQHGLATPEMLDSTQDLYFKTRELCR